MSGSKRIGLDGMREAFRYFSERMQEVASLPRVVGSRGVLRLLRS